MNGAAGIVEGPECLERLEGLKGPKCHQRLQRLLCLGHFVHPERLKGLDSLEGLEGETNMAEKCSLIKTICIIVSLLCLSLAFVAYPMKEFIAWESKNYQQVIATVIQIECNACDCPPCIHANESL